MSVYCSQNYACLSYLKVWYLPGVAERFGIGTSLRVTYTRRISRLLAKTRERFEGHCLRTLAGCIRRLVGYVSFKLSWLNVSNLLTQ
jgi:hypothetical protein